MAEAARVSELDPAGVERGADLIEQLALRGVGIELAAWVYLHFVREWRLKLVTSAIESKGRKGLLHLARGILADMHGAPFDEFDVDFEAPDDPVYMALARRGTTISRSMLMTPIQTDGLQLDAIYFYFARADDAPPVAQDPAVSNKPRKWIKT